MLPQPGFSEQELLQLAASLERASEHPLAAAMVRAAEQQSLSLVNVQAFSSIPGMGVSGQVDGRRVGIGNEGILRSISTNPSILEQVGAEYRAQGEMVTLLSVDGRAAGVISIANQIRHLALEAVRQLKADGIELAMVMGDNAITARAVAETLGREYVAGVLPAGNAVW